MGNENDPDNIANPELVERMFSSYEKFTGIKFAFGDKKSGSDAYFEDLVDRATRGGSGLNPTNIDLVIVADQLLTGYDSKKLNTLYVDRSLELQGLIQAYSRTNRVFKKNKKDFGMIVNFQYPALTKKRVNTALELYGSGGKSSLAIVERYGDAVAKFANLVSKMQDTLKYPANWMDLKSDEDALKKFMDAFLAAAKQLSHVQQYYEYKWSNKKFTISEHQWMKYRGAYQNLRGTGIVDPPDEPVDLISTQSKLVDTQQVTADSILKLIGNKKSQAHNNQLTKDDLQKIEDWIQDLSDQGEYQKAQLIKQFLNEVVLTEQEEAIEDINDEFGKWKQRQLARKVGNFARKWGIDEGLLQKSVQNYNPTDPEVIPYITDLNKAISFDDAEDKSCGNLLKHKMTVMKELPKWMANTTKQYR